MQSNCQAGRHIGGRAVVGMTLLEQKARGIE